MTYPRKTAAYHGLRFSGRGFTCSPSLIGPDEPRDGEIIKRMRHLFGRTFRVLAERVRESAFLEV